MITLNMNRLGVRVVVAVVLLQLSQEPTLARAETPARVCEPGTFYLLSDDYCVGCLELLSKEDKANVSFRIKPQDANVRVPLVVPPELRGVDINLDEVLHARASPAGSGPNSYLGTSVRREDGSIDFARPIAFAFEPPLALGLNSITLSFPEEHACEDEAVEYDGDSALYLLSVETLPQTLDEVIERLEIVPGRLGEVVHVEPACCPVDAKECDGDDCFQCWKQATFDHAYFKWNEPGSYYVAVDLSYAEEEQARPSAYGAGLVVFESERPSCALATISAPETSLVREIEVCIPHEFQGVRNPEVIDSGTLEVAPSSCLAPPQASDSYFGIVHSLHVVRASTEEEAMRLLDPESTDDPPNDTSDEPISQPNDESGSKGCAVTGTGVRSESDVWFWGVLVLGAIAAGRLGSLRASARLVPWGSSDV